MNKRNIIIIIGILVFVAIIGGISYSYFVYNKDVGSITMNTGGISFSYNNVTNSLNSVSSIPVSDNYGKTQNNYIDFTVTGTVDTESILYEIDIIPNSGNTLDGQYIKVYLSDQNDNALTDPFLYTELYDSMGDNGKGLYQEIIKSNSESTINYSKSLRLRVWVDERYRDLLSKNFSFDLNVYSMNVSDSEMKKVTFNTNEGRQIIRYYNVNDVMTNVPNPVRDGQTFVEWVDIANGMPNEYEKYEYVETDGSQYFNSGYFFDNDTRIKIDFMTPSNIPTNVSTVLYYSGYSNYSGFALGSKDLSGRYRVFYRASWDSGQYLSTNTRYSLYFNKEKVYLNNNLVHTFSLRTFTTEYSMPFFAQYYRNTNPINFAPNGTRIYYIEIFQDSTLVRYFVPALNKTTNLVGFYDMVESKFYDNLGSGAFSGVTYTGNNTEVDEELLDANMLYAKWTINNS